ncbi:MAG: helix-turn-helix domain-containing protein [Hyphomicrobiaceae bacterium]
MASRKTFAQNLRTARKQAGYARARHFAHEVGINENNYTRYERGDAEPSLDNLREICRALRVTADDLIGGTVSSAVHPGPAGLAEEAGRYDASAPRDTSADAGALLRGHNEAELAACRWELAAAFARASISAEPGSGELLKRTSDLYRALEDDPYGTVAGRVAEIGQREGSERVGHLAAQVERFLEVLAGMRSRAAD